MKEHQIATCAATVSKEDFPGLIAQLWKVTLLPAHLIHAISPLKLNKADPHVDTKPPEKPQAVSQDPQDQSQPPSQDPADFEIRLCGQCTINQTVTPIRMHLKGYFTKVLQKNRQARNPKVDKRKVKPKFYGEALTADDVYERMLQEEEEKKRVAEEKRQAAEEKKRAAGKKKTAATKKVKTTKKRTTKGRGKQNGYCRKGKG